MNFQMTEVIDVHLFCCCQDAGLLVMSDLTVNKVPITSKQLLLLVEVFFNHFFLPIHIKKGNSLNASPLQIIFIQQLSLSQKNCLKNL